MFFTIHSKLLYQILKPSIPLGCRFWTYLIVIINIPHIMAHQRPKITPQVYQVTEPWNPMVYTWTVHLNHLKNLSPANIITRDTSKLTWIKDGKLTSNSRFNVSEGKLKKIIFHNVTAYLLDGVKQNWCNFASCHI